MTERLEENVALFADLWPLDAYKVQSEEFDPIQWGPYDEGLSNWKEKLPLQGILSIIVYGIGSGQAFDHLKTWLKTDTERHLVFLEDDLRLLRGLFESEKATEILSHPQVTLCYVQGGELSPETLEFLYWSFGRTKFLVTALPFYVRTKASIAKQLSDKIHYEAELKAGLVEEYQKLGVSFFRNFYSNMKELPGAFWGNKLFGQFEGIPAIILGAGPSLNKQIPLLKELESKALIFAGGSALNAIKSQSLKPHFGAGIDPNDTQLARLKETSELAIPFFYRSRLFATAIREIKGPRLYVSGAGGYDISEWYEEKFSITSDFLDEGHNVVNFCTELAVRLGCNPIIYVGLDLAFTGNASYSDGVNDTIQCSDTLVRKDIYGKDTTTQWRWVFEADWLSQYAKSHPEITFYNATEGGIGIPGVENVLLRTLSEEKLVQTFPLHKQIQKALNEAKLPHVTPDKIEAATQELKESLERSLSLINLLLVELDKEAAKEVPQDKLVSGRAILLESDLFDEPAYQYILDIFHHVFARITYKQSARLKQNKGQLKNAKELAIEKLELQRNKLLFLKDVAQANLLLIQFAERI